MPQILRVCIEILQLLQGSHLDNFALKTVKLDLVAFHSVKVSVEMFAFSILSV